MDLEKGDLDLAALHGDTTERIRNAGSRAEAEQAMRRFVKAFKDGHLSLRSSRRPDWEVEKLKVNVLSRNTPPANACATLGYDGWLSSDLPFDFRGVAGFKSFEDSNVFAAGVLIIDGHRVGLVRVSSFYDRNFVGTCQDEWSRRRLTLDTTCEGECDVALRMAIRNRPSCSSSRGSGSSRRPESSWLCWT